jgi:acetyltransferase-like isoleucine patch superfamily enzyme
VTAPTPIERDNALLEKNEPLTTEDKKRFAYFGVNAKILPPYRILNPQHVSIGDFTAVREGCHINAFRDLSFLRDYVDPRYRDEVPAERYRYEATISIARECQIGRFAFFSCTNCIELENNVVLSERVFLGDNNHTFSHPEIPIVQQPNKPGRAIVIGTGSWIGVGAAILAGVRLGRNTVVGANSVVREGDYPDHAVIAPPAATVLFRRHERE